MLSLALVATAAELAMAYLTLDQASDSIILPVTYSDAMQPIVKVTVGGQELDLIFDTGSADTAVFAQACTPSKFEPCYRYDSSRTARICKDQSCTVPSNSFSCQSLPSGTPMPTGVTTHTIDVDGVLYSERRVEGVESMAIVLKASGHDDNQTFAQQPVRFVTETMAKAAGGTLASALFSGVSGILGTSGPSLSCRQSSLWDSLLSKQSQRQFALQFQPPPQSPLFDSSKASWVTFGAPTPDVESTLVWSEQKQTGDPINDGRLEFLLFHPKTCGVDLLYNTSSNWLTVLDTAGPCLTLPGFVFDAMMSHVPVTCPFSIGESSNGRLCSPTRVDSGPSLPSFSFTLEDVTLQKKLTELVIPLERLVYSDASGEEFVCVARANETDMSQSQSATTQSPMTLSPITFGSMVIAALYTVVDESRGIGMKSVGSLSEVTDAYCATKTSCISSMQTYFPPLNMCEDPQCSEYLLMTLNDTTKMCTWTKVVPFCFGLLLFCLVGLDLISFKLYRKAIVDASEIYQ